MVSYPLRMVSYMDLVVHLVVWYEIPSLLKPRLHWYNILHLHHTSGMEVNEVSDTSQDGVCGSESDLRSSKVVTQR